MTYTISFYSPGRKYAGATLGASKPVTARAAVEALTSALLEEKARTSRTWASNAAWALIELSPSSITLGDGTRITIDTQEA